MKIDYRAFIEDYFFIKNKKGILVPFKFNDVQNLWYNQLLESYGPELKGIRENDLKGRQFGISSIITGIFAADFILSELGEIPIIDSDIYSHKDEETTVHIQRFSLFLNSFLVVDQGGGAENMEETEAIEALRKEFLSIDNGGHMKSRRRGAQYHAQTASAKVSGRGGTKQNIHWSEPAFYPNTDIMNAKKLMVGAEKQVPDDYGKIFRESTGRSRTDYFAQEYFKGKEGRGSFQSRFLAWYLYKDYNRPAPSEWDIPEYYKSLVDQSLASLDQCFWHWEKTDHLQDKEELREYPTYDKEAFLSSGSAYFNETSMREYLEEVEAWERSNQNVYTA